MSFSLVGLCRNALALVIILMPLINSAGFFALYPALVFFISLYLLVKMIVDNTGLPLFFYILLLSLVLMFFLALLTLKVTAMYFVFISIYSLLVSYWLLGLNVFTLNRIAFMALFFFYSFIVYSGINIGWTHLDMNLYLNNASRNYLTAMAIFYQTLYYATSLRAGRGAPLFTSTITFVFCVFAIGRSGIIISLFLLLVVIVHYSFRKGILFSFIMATFFSLICFFNLDSIFNILLDTKLSRGFETERSLIFLSYLDGISVDTLITGIDLKTIPIVLSFGGNPHNSFILGHSLYGLVYVIFILLIVSFVVVFLLANKNNIILFLLLMFLIIRACFDIIVFFGPLDFVIYFLIFSMSTSFSRTMKTRRLL